MPSFLSVTFREERTGPDSVRLIIKTVSKGLGSLGLPALLAAGLYLALVLGSPLDDIRTPAPRALINVLGVAGLLGLGHRLFGQWAARKTSGVVSFFSPSRTLSQHGLEALFPWTECELPRDAIVVLDAARVRSRHAPSEQSRRPATVHWRLWCLPPAGMSPDQVVPFVDTHRASPFHGTFYSLDEVPMPPGAVLLGHALENPIFRRVAAMLVDHGGCTAFDATGTHVDRLGTKATVRSVAISAETRHVIPTSSWPIRIFLTVVAFVFATFIALVTRNPYVFVYLVALALMGVSKNQVLVCNAAGLHLYSSYFMGLWRRGDHHQRWNEIATIQFANAPNGALVLAIRRDDGDDWKIVVPTARVRRQLEEQFKDRMGA